MSQQNARVIQEIKTRLNIVDIVRQYIKLQRNGTRWTALCPFHQETTPSFSVNEEDGFFYCFGCQASGDLLTFYSQINGLTFRETLEQLAEEAGIILSKFTGPVNIKKSSQSNRRILLKIHEFALTYFMNLRNANVGKECREYMSHRGISNEIAQEFGLGWSSRDWNMLSNALKRAGFDEKLGVEAALLGKSSNGNYYDRFRGRLIFPIYSLSRNIIAFGGRIIGNEDEAKYINSSDSPLYKKGDHLYGLQQARQRINIEQSVLVTEGYMDVITLHQYGYTNSVGVLGTALTPEQLKRISGFTSKVEILFDGDNAGRKAALRACEMFLTKGMNCNVILLPEGEDIDSILKIYGKEFFKKLRESAVDGLHFCIHTVRNMAPREIVDWVRNFLKQVELPELGSRFTSILATGLGLAENELREYVVENKGIAKRKVVLANTLQNPIQGNPRDKQILMFLVRYPHMLNKLKEIGAHLILNSVWAKELWRKYEEYPVDDIIHYLSSEEKSFWVRCRTGDVPPLNNEEGEFIAIQTILGAVHMTVQSASVSEALRYGVETSDFEVGLEYLRALQETLERTHGE